MKLKVDWKVNLKDKEVMEKVEEAAKKGLKEVVIAIANDVIKGSPVKTGHNKRSIDYKSTELEGSIYSTSGYGGFLETGTSKMPARPYFKPALDRNAKNLPKNIRAHL